MSETIGVGAEALDTSYHQRRLAQRLEDPTFRAEYERARTEIRQVDEVMRTLDSLRESAGITKAELARKMLPDLLRGGLVSERFERARLASLNGMAGFAG